MNIPILHSGSRAVTAKFAFSAMSLIGALLLGGCVVHERSRERGVCGGRRPPPGREVVVERPAPEPVTQVVYEPAPPEVVTVYERDLTPHGHWVLIGRYGRCWVWDRRPAHWRPYTVGHWV